MSATSIRASAPAVLEALRAQTGQLHTGLEKRMPFFSPRLDHALYTRLIKAYYGFYQPLETALHSSGCLPRGLDFAARRKVPALVRDLQALGLGPSDLHSLPVCQQLPVIENLATCLGVLYVVEGATLGGQILRREMQTRLGVEQASGAAFLDVYGSETGQRWKGYLNLLAEQPTDPAFTQAAALAAQSTFSCFEQWLDDQEILS